MFKPQVQETRQQQEKDRGILFQTIKETKINFEYLFGKHIHQILPAMNNTYILKSFDMNTLALTHIDDSGKVLNQLKQNMEEFEIFDAILVSHYLCIIYEKQDDKKQYFILQWDYENEKVQKFTKQGFQNFGADRYIFDFNKSGLLCILEQYEQQSLTNQNNNTKIQGQLKKTYQYSFVYFKLPLENNQSEPIFTLQLKNMRPSTIVQVNQISKIAIIYETLFNNADYKFQILNIDNSLIQNKESNTIDQNNVITHLKQYKFSTQNFINTQNMISQPLILQFCEFIPKIFYVKIVFFQKEVTQKYNQFVNNQTELKFYSYVWNSEKQTQPQRIGNLSQNWHYIQFMDHFRDSMHNELNHFLRLVSTLEQESLLFNLQKFKNNFKNITTYYIDYYQNSYCQIVYEYKQQIQINSQFRLSNYQIISCNLQHENEFKFISLKQNTIKHLKLPQLVYGRKVAIIFILNEIQKLVNEIQQNCNKFKQKWDEDLLYYICQILNEKNRNYD